MRSLLFTIAYRGELMSYKICTSCKNGKPLVEFYKQPSNSDGRAGRCKDCHKASMKKNRRENPEVRVRDRARAKLPHRKEASRAVVIRWRKENPEAYKAQTAVGNALRDGKIERQPCEECGETRRVHAHHDDYSRPLVVRWLCPLHHHRHHADYPAAGNSGAL